MRSRDALTAVLVVGAAVFAAALALRRDEEPVRPAVERETPETGRGPSPVATPGPRPRPPPPETAPPTDTAGMASRDDMPAAPSGDGSIAGRVLDADGKPVAGAAVEARAQGADGPV